MREDRHSTPKAAAVDAGATIRALDMPTRRRFVPGATGWHGGAQRRNGAVGLDIDTAPVVGQA
jgi:hypothetical protein